MRHSASRLPLARTRALATITALALLTACGSDAASTLAAPAAASAVKFGNGGGGKPSQNPVLVFSSYGRSCSILADAITRCWGYNQEGELGDGTTTPRPSPTPVIGGISFVTLSLGDTQSCGLTGAGKAYCWGTNGFGSLGDGTTTDPQLAPSPVLGNDAFVQIGTGTQHSCGLLADGSTKCWGSNSNGPQPVAGPTFVSLTHGAIHICGLTATGAAYCWGVDGGFNVGQLGYGTTDFSNTPLPVIGGIKFASIAAGYTHTCGLDGRGRAYCWGSNYIGQVGDGTIIDKLEPTPVATSLRFAKIVGGNSQTCALTRKGDAYCWGNGYSGQLGDGLSHMSTTPVPVSGGIRFSSIAGASSTVCGVSRDDVPYCWGSNFFGAVGDGTTTDALVPTRVLQ